MSGPKRIDELAAVDPQLRELAPDPDISAALAQPELPYSEVIATVLDGYASRPALRERAYAVETDPDSGRARRRYLEHYDGITYGQLHERVKAVASAWQHDLVHRVAPGEFVCTLGFSGTDYVTIDLASAYVQAVSVPLQTTLATADLDGIIADTAPVTVAATVSDLVAAATFAGSHASIRSIVAIDYADDDDREQFAGALAELRRNGSGAQLITLPDLIALGDAGAFAPLPRADEGAERMALIVHSSGSTGTPKGAIITERIAKSQWVPTPRFPVVRIVFAPMNHMGGRAMVYMTFARGGTACFTAKPDLSTLFEDIRLVRPTELMFFPRVIEMIHRYFLGEVMRRTPEGETSTEATKAAVMEEMGRTFLGDRLCFFGVATAPTTPEMKRFVSECFGMPLDEGYGTTEAAHITFADRILRPPVTDYRVRDVPELGYFATDEPYPRGELCVKTELATPGYFKRPEATANLFDEDAFIRTGDIVEERGPDHVVLIDRRNDVLKLSQGEYVALGALGTTFESHSDVIHQIYLHGSSARAYVLAVVVPNPDVVDRALGRGAAEAEVRDLIRGELKEVAAVANLRSFEVPREFIIEREPFSHENGLLSSVYKRLRPALHARYGQRLEALYEELERKQHDDLLAFRGLRTDMTVLEKVGKALEACLGLDEVDVSQPFGFVDLGGDSLGATELAAVLEDMFGVDVPVNAILSPAGNPQHWARLIEAALAEDEQRLPTFERIHGEGSRTIHATDLDIVAFMGDASPVRPAGVRRGPPQVVLVTGATGFLGRFLCLEWLDRVSATGGKVICLVRAADGVAGQQRLASAFGTADPLLAERFAALAQHLEVLVGDVAEPRLGLGEADFERLANEVDRIVHPGALVNHVLGYEHLFGPNVAGTAELVRLGLTHRLKPFDFVSSVAATLMVDTSAGIDEDAPLLPSVELADHYVNGYASSKWAAEQLLHSASRRYGLPVNVFRGDMMLAHRRYHQQINAGDIFTRLLASIVQTGLAPQSFYRPALDGSTRRPHYDGLTVDFLAAAIADIGSEPHDGLRTYHVVNHHDDGISLDTFVDWVEDAGYAVERLSDYATWLHHFEAKLRALPEEQRQHSSLGVLDSLRFQMGAEVPVGSDRFQAAVRRSPVGPEVPQLSREFLLKCLDDMLELRLVPARPLIGAPSGQAV